MRTVLIADASEHCRDTLARALSREYRVHTCADGLRALELTRQLRPDVLVMDLMLTGRDGLSVLKELEEQELTPRIIVTGRYFSGYITSALERYQVDSVLLKPLSVQCVAEHVAQVLEQAEGPIPFRPDPFDCVTALLVRLGAPASQQGFRFLRRGILLLMQDPAQQLTKSLYPAIAAEFGTSKENVEKALRTTVTAAWARRRDEVWRSYFPQAPGGHIPRPTAGQFLIRIAESVQSTLRMQA